ncbi:hypothetical protein Tco_0020220 [Tanacetum coccineum]
MTTSSIPIDTSSGPKHVSAGRGRKTKNDSSSSSQKKNKQPQRGMGVEKLEHIIRLQTEIAPPPPPPPAPFNNTFAVPHHQLNGPFQFRQLPVNYFNGVVGDHHHHVYQNMTTNELSSIHNSYAKCVSDGYGASASYKKKRINGGGSNTCSVNPYRNYAASNSAFVETIDAGRPRLILVREVKEVMPVPRNGMNLMTEYEFFPGKNSVVGDAGEMMRTASSTWCGNGLGLGVGGGGGASVDGRMLGLRAGDGSCVTAITGNEEGCVSSLDLTLKL